jgi:hypothetical protein
MERVLEKQPRPDTWYAAETDTNGQPIRMASEALSDSDIEYLRANITKKAARSYFFIDYRHQLTVSYRNAKPIVDADPTSSWTFCAVAG